MSQFIEWSALGQVVVVSLLVGAGLPALFAVGVRLIASPGARDTSGALPLWRRAGAIAAFGSVAAAIAVAVAVIAAGGH